MTSKKIMLVEAGSVRHCYLLHEFGDSNLVWKQRVENNWRSLDGFRRLGTLLLWLRDQNLHGWNFVSPRKPLLRVPMTALYIERAYRESVVAVLRSER